MSNQKTLITNLSEVPILKGILRFAIPIMLANLLQAVYSMVDMIVVGQFSGPVGLSAVLLGHFIGLTGFWLGNGLAGFVTTIVMGIYYLTGRWKSRQLVTE